MSENAEEQPMTEQLIQALPPRSREDPVEELKRYAEQLEELVRRHRVRP